MRKIAIIGYNIFSPGGTTRSNLNLLKEFSKFHFQLMYFNEVEFTKIDVIKLRKNEGLDDSIQFYTKQQIEAYGFADLYILTREPYFKLAKLLKSLNPHCKVVGELHGPLPLLTSNLSDCLPFIDCIRVATPSIKEQFIEKYQYDRIFVQTVSLHHLIDLPQESCQQTNNLFIYSRFDEKTKDIAYAIKLIAYIVHELNFHDIRLYINGYGKGEDLYKKLIDCYRLSKYVMINGDIPKHYIYMCTSTYETFGYSIVEAIWKGQRAVLYCGDDNVLKENFFNLKTVQWLTKNLLEDGEKLITFLKTAPKDDDNQLDRELITNMNQEFANDFLDNISQFSVPASPVQLTKNEIRTLLGKERAIFFYYRGIKKIYRLSSKVPGVKVILTSKTFKKYAFQMIDLLKRTVKNDKDLPLKENSFFIESFHGKSFSGDPKYIALAIQRAYPDAEIYVSSANDLVDMEIRSFHLTPVRLGSANYVAQFHQCKYVITNGNLINLLKKREGQVFIQTWHGFPFKRMVNDLKNTSQRKRETQAFIQKMINWDYLLTSSELNTKLLNSAFQLKTNENLQIIEEGLPKNEFLIENKENNELRETLHLKYFHKKYNPNKKYILFCPTWRKSKRKEVTRIDLVKLVSLLPKEYELIVKLHPNEGGLVKEYSELYDRIHCFYNELVDIQELYLLSDVLISDYSSSIFDFAHLGRKIIVLQEDTDEYGSDIGWYFDLEKVCGLKAGAWSVEELASLILSPSIGDYHDRITTKLLTNDQLGSTKKIMEKIFGYTNESFKDYLGNQEDAV